MQTISDVKNEIALIIKESGEDPADYDIDQIINAAARDTGNGYVLDREGFWPAVWDAMITC